MKYSNMRPGDLFTMRGWRRSHLYLLTATRGSTMEWLDLDTGELVSTQWDPGQDEIGAMYVVARVARGTEELP